MTVPFGVTTAVMLILERGMRHSGPMVKYDRNGGGTLCNREHHMCSRSGRGPELIARLLLSGGVVEVAGDESLDARVQVPRGSFTA
jgi:hypothetical protein